MAEPPFFHVWIGFKAKEEFLPKFINGLHLPSPSNLINAFKVFTRSSHAILAGIPNC